MSPKDRTGQEAWSRRPTTDDLGVQWPILRVPATGKLQVIVLSHDLIGCYTHYHRGRTEPCTQDACDACAARTERRWHGWLGIRAIRSGACYILEVTAKASSPIDEYYRAHRTLRGAIMTLHRYPARPNGRVHATLTHPDAPPADLPACIDLQAQLLRMWSRSTQPARPQIHEPPTPPGELEHERRKHRELNDQTTFDTEPRTGTD